MLETRVIDECSVEIGRPMSEVDPAFVRSAFSDLAECCMSAAQSHRLDADDVLLDCKVLLKRSADDEPVLIEVGLAADFAGWLAAYNRVRTARGREPCSVDQVHLASLQMRVSVELGAPLWADARPDRNL